MFELTDKEIELYDYLVTGYYSQEDIAKTFKWNSRTAPFYLKSLKQKGVWLMEKRVKKSKGKSIKVYKIRQWSAKNKLDCCISCHKLSIRHKGRGLCLHCWDKERDKTTQRQKTKKKARDNWYKKSKRY